MSFDLKRNPHWLSVRDMVNVLPARCEGLPTGRDFPCCLSYRRWGSFFSVVETNLLRYSVVDCKEGHSGGKFTLPAGHAGNGSAAEKFSNGLFEEGPNLPLSASLGKLAAVGFNQAIQQGAASFQDGHDISKINVLGMPGQDVTTPGPTAALDEAGLVKGGEDLFQIGFRYSLPPGNPGGLLGHTDFALG
jgi:hypothetical protein